MPDNPQIPFDYLGAKKAGYSDQEIQSFLNQKYSMNFDIPSAKQSGYSDNEIASFISNYNPDVKKKEGGSALGETGSPISNLGGVVGNLGSQLNGKTIQPTGTLTNDQLTSPVLAGIKADQESKNSFLAGMYNKVVESVANLAGGTANIAEKFSNASFPNPSGEALLKHYNIQQPQSDIGNKVQKLVEFFRSPASSPENEAARSQFDITKGFTLDNLKALAFNAPSMLTDIGGMILTRGGTSFAQSYNEADNELKSRPDYDKLSPTVKELYPFLQGSVSMAIANLNIPLLAGKSGVVKNLTTDVSNKVVDKLVSKELPATIPDVEQAVNEEVGNIAKQSPSILAKIGKGALGGALYGAGQSAASDASKLLANKINGTDIFDTQDIKAHFLKNMLNSALQTIPIGGVFGAVHGLTETTDGIRKEVANNVPVEDIKNKINDQVNQGNLTPQEADIANKKVDEVSGINNSIPDNISPAKKETLLPLFEQRNTIQNEIDKEIAKKETIDPVFHGEIDEKINGENGLKDQLKVANKNIKDVIEQPEQPTQTNEQDTGLPKVITENTWHRGVNKNNAEQGDKFYSTDESTAHDYAINKVGEEPNMTQLSKEELPKNPLVVGTKEDLAAEMKFPEKDIYDLKGDFDKKAKEYAQLKGHDAIVYESGSMDNPEMHIFEKTKQDTGLPSGEKQVYGGDVGGDVESNELHKLDRGDMQYHIEDKMENGEIDNDTYDVAKFINSLFGRTDTKNINYTGYGSVYMEVERPDGTKLKFRVSDHRSKNATDGDIDIRIGKDKSETAENIVQELYDGNSQPIYWERQPEKPEIKPNEQDTGLPSGEGAEKTEIKPISENIKEDDAYVTNNVGTLEGKDVTKEDVENLKENVENRTVPMDSKPRSEDETNHLLTRQIGEGEDQPIQVNRTNKNGEETQVERPASSEVKRLQKQYGALKILFDCLTK